MNEKFGFLSHFHGVKLNLKKKDQPLLAVRGELTDNPPIRNRVQIEYLTDDDSEEDLDRTESLVLAPPEAKPANNKIFDSSLSSSNTFEPNATSSKRGPSSRSSNRNQIKTSSGLADTVVGAFSELSSQLSLMSVKDKLPISPKAGLRKTIIGRFSDLSEDIAPVPTPPRAVVKKNPTNQLADTIIQSSSDEEDPQPATSKKPVVPQVFIKQRNPKPSLPDTILGFSESMSGLSSAEPSAIEKIEEVKEMASEEESEYDEDVITILDSDEEEEEVMNNDDQLPIVDAIESFHNCSSIDNSEPKHTDSDTTVNKFFNNPPLITSPERFITHSVIRRHRETPYKYPVVEEEPKKATTVSESVNRLKIVNDENESDQDKSFDYDNFVLPETDVSDLHQTFNRASQNDDIRERTDVETRHSSEQSNVNNQESVELLSSKRTDKETRASRQLTMSSNLTQSTLDQSTVIEKINISANININLKISMRHSSGTSSSESSSSSSSSSDNSQPPPRKNKPRNPPANEKQNDKTPRRETPRKETPRKETPRKETPRKETPKAGPSSNKKVASIRKEKQNSTPGSGRKSNLQDIPSPAVLLEIPANRNDYRTPRKSDEFGILDDDLQAVLSSVYGDSWKTPQLLQSCKSKKVLQDLRKSIHANNFDSFVKNLSNDLESTRVTAASSKESENGSKFEPLDIRRSWKKQQHSITPTLVKPKEPESSKKKTASKTKKTPRRVSTSDESDFDSPLVKAKPKQTVKSTAKTTPKYLEICDSDTPTDDSSSDNDFDCNETWNASSDEEYENEQERIKKHSIMRKSRKDEEIIFIPDNTFDERKKKLDELHDRFEFKKPPGILTPKVTKKKLFTHDHYEDEVLPPVEESTNKEKENLLPFMIWGDIFRKPLPAATKNLEIKVPTPPSKAPRRAPKVKVPTPKPVTEKAVKKTAFSFLKSLDVEANAILCDPVAYDFRKNFKTKKSELTNVLFKLFNEKIFGSKLTDVPIKWNKKLLNTAGRCNNSRRNGVRMSQLELSDKVLTSADRLRCTLVHEMCHAATWIFHGDNGHGATWKSYAAKANATFPELPKISVCHDYIIEYKYTYQCKHCKGKYQTHSKCKKVEKIQCSICKGAIELFLNKKDKNGDIIMTPVSKVVKGFAKFVQSNYSKAKQSQISHKDVMQALSARYAALSVEEKQNL